MISSPYRSLLILVGLLVVSAACGSRSVLFGEGQVEAGRDGGANFSGGGSTGGAPLSGGQGGLGASGGAFPPSGGSPDVLPIEQPATLMKLSVTPGQLTPAFEPSILSYVVPVAADVDEVTILAIADTAQTLITLTSHPNTDSELGELQRKVRVPDSGLYQLEVVVTKNEGASTTYRILLIRENYQETTYIKGNTPQANDYLGFSLAIDGDTLAIGASGEGAPMSEDSAAEGAVYIFHRKGASFEQEAYLKASNPGAGDGFGWRVALDGDRLLVGAYAEDSSAGYSAANPYNDGAPDAGAAYVFERSGGEWHETAYLKADAPHANDWFGRRVAIRGDWLAIGAYGEDGGGTGDPTDPTENSAVDSGAVYLFHHDNGSWLGPTYLKAPNADPGDQFGFGLALSDEFLAVGALGESSRGTDPSDNSQLQAGAVYIYRLADDSFDNPTFLKPNEIDANDRFGATLSLHGSTLAVGAFGEDSHPRQGQSDASLQNSGAVFIFEHQDETWQETAFLKPSYLDARDWFGVSVSLFEDTLAVGAFGEDGPASELNPTVNSLRNSGAAYLFERRGQSWTETSYVKAKNAGAGDRFGWSVGVSGKTLAVGAFGEGSGSGGLEGDPGDDSASSSGAVYVFEKQR